MGRIAQPLNLKILLSLGYVLKKVVYHLKKILLQNYVFINWILMFKWSVIELKIIYRGEDDN